ncbi:MAG: DUF2634 domain-containing protein [Lachnospiraceae bacterium]|nr:DUF2634 domain-containing protein [Lachnospiraceae bacterium]
MTDIRLDSGWQLTPAASGDAPLTDDTEGLLQTIRTEAITQEGELFYDTDFGWSLLDFIHAQESELVKIEIESRIRKKLAKYGEIISGTVEIQQAWSSDALDIAVTFKLADTTEHKIETSLNRIEVEIE